MQDVIMQVKEELGNLDGLQVYDTGELLAGKKSNNGILGFAGSSPFVPKTKTYIRDNWFIDIVMHFRFSREPLYIYGPTGCGKTSGIKYLASLIKYPVYEVTGHARLEFADIVGHHIIDKTGKMDFQYGPLPMAMKSGGIFLINEMDLLDPGVAAGLNSILDGSPLLIPENGGEVITAHPMFRFIATGNTCGSGDDSGYYQGVMRQNVALMDRFVVLMADYHTEKSGKELGLLGQTHPELPEKTRENMVKFANVVRTLFKGGEVDGVKASQVEVTMSTRALLRWATCALCYEPLRKQGGDPVLVGLMRACGYRGSLATQKTFKEIYQRVFDNGKDN